MARSFVLDEEERQPFCLSSFTGEEEEEGTLFPINKEEEEEHALFLYWGSICVYLAMR